MKGVIGAKTCHSSFCFAGIFAVLGYYLNHLSQIKNKWTELTGIKETSYELESNDLLKTSYYDKSDKI